MNNEKGRIVFSKAGHDKLKVYVIIDYDNEYYYLSDGDIRTLDKLKKKRIKHVQKTNTYINQLVDNIDDLSNITNEHIKYAIRLFKKDGK